MTNNLSLFATDDSCISVITFCFSYFFWLPLDSFNSNILQMTIVLLFATYGIIWFRKQQFFLKTTKKY